MLEIRFLAPEVRVAGRTLSGIAVPFDQAATIRANGGSFRETVRPGAFAACLAAKSDITALADHDATRLLGRTRTGTLRLSETRAGLAFEVDLPETPSGLEFAALGARGELAGCSIGFTIPKGGDAWAGEVRTISAATLDHVAIISGGRPAYDGTTAALRHQGGAQWGAAALRRAAWVAQL